MSDWLFEQIVAPKSSTLLGGAVTKVLLGQKTEFLVCPKRGKTARLPASFLGTPV